MEDNYLEPDTHWWTSMSSGQFCPSGQPCPHGHPENLWTGFLSSTHISKHSLFVDFTKKYGYLC